MPAIYFSMTQEVALAEADAKAKRYGWASLSYPAKTLAAFQLKLHAVLDLTDAATLKALNVKKKELIGCDWEAEQLALQEPLTQALSRAAFETFAEGLVVPSARANGANVIVFPTNLKLGSAINAHDEANIPFVHGL